MSEPFVKDEVAKLVGTGETAAPLVLKDLLVDEDFRRGDEGGPQDARAQVG